MQFWTVGEVATYLNVPLHRVEYALNTRRIEPVGRPGGSRIFDEAGVEAIRAVIKETASGRGRRSRALPPSPSGSAA